MLRIICVVVCVLLALNTDAQKLGFSITDGRKSIRIPIEIYDNLIVVPVIVNNKLPLRFILDTGVRTTILTDKSLCDMLNMVYTRHYLVSAPGIEKRIEAYITDNVRLDLPGVRGEGHSMMVLAEDYLDLRSVLGTDVYGIIGYELFSRFIVKINYKKKTLDLITKEKFRPPKSFESVSIKVEDTKPYILTSVSINDTTKQKVKLLVDTGASHSLLLEPDSDDKITIPQPSLHSIIGLGLGGVITGQMARINALHFGNYRIDSPIASFPDPNSYQDTLKTSQTIFRNGTIGGEVLSRFTVIFDFSGEKMYFKKNSHFNKKFYLNLSGIAIKATGALLKDYEITDVREGSAAYKAELLKGDRILKINEADATDLTLNNIIGIFNSSPGKKISMTVERGGAKLRKEFLLENQI